MKITAIIDCYNSAPYVEEAIRGVLAQERGADQILLVDDGSTDDTAAIAERLLGGVPHARVIRKENGGQLSCISAGIAEASGDLIALLDGDDYWLPNHLEEAEKVFIDHPQLAQYACNYIVEGSANETVRDEPDYLYEDTYVVTALSEAFIGNVTAALVYRTSCLKPYLPLPKYLEKDWIMNADNVLIWMASLTGRQKMSSESQNIVYRFHEQNMHLASKQRRAKALKRSSTKRLFEYFRREFYISDDTHLGLIREYKSHVNPPRALKRGYRKAAMSSSNGASLCARCIYYLRVLF